MRWKFHYTIQLIPKANKETTKSIIIVCVGEESSPFNPENMRKSRYKQIYNIFKIQKSINLKNIKINVI